jgi:hypothetical protein
MDLIQQISQVFTDHAATLEVKNGLFTAAIVIAERKAFLSKKKLTFIAKFRIDPTQKAIRYTEMLKESGWGLSSGDIDSSAGFGFKTETYKTGMGPREGSIEEQSTLFGKKYSYSFDFKTIRAAVEQKAQAAGFTFKYQITSIGL